MGVWGEGAAGRGERWAQLSPPGALSLQVTGRCHLLKEMCGAVVPRDRKSQAQFLPEGWGCLGSPAELVLSLPACSGGCCRFLELLEHLWHCLGSRSVSQHRALSLGGG